MKIQRACFLSLLFLAGCGEPYGVKDVGEDAHFREQQSSAARDGRLSEQSQACLRRHGLYEAFEKSPRDAIDGLLVQFGKQPTRPAAFALAELCFIAGSRETAASDDAARCQLSSAIFAYAFMFDPQLPGTCSPFDRRYAMAREIYNRALAGALARHPLSGNDWSDAATLPSLIGPVRITEQAWKLPWPRAAFDRFECAYRYSVFGIDDPAHQDGMGVPLIAFRSSFPSDTRAKNDAFLPNLPTKVLGATMCVRFHGSIVDAVQNRTKEMTADVAVLDPMVDGSIDVAGRSIPIEADIATPLAFSIEHAPPLSGFKGFLDTTSWGDRHGLYMTHPYQPGKIPVVFIYGLMGKPTTWVPMFNHLISNEALRSRFQFWYFMYPTGNPVLYSAAVLREQMANARQLYDPNGTDPTFNQMVIVGHSLGGLVTQLQVIDSGNDIWNAVMHRPFNTNMPSDPTSALVKSAFFFKSAPFVTRVIFMATPHRGSALADSWFARTFSSDVRVSEDVRLATEKYVEPATTNPSFMGHEPTAVQSLSVENPVLLTLDHLPIPNRIKFHSIIANRDAAGVAGGTDSLVPYTSSHLDGAVSETIIHSKHGCTRNPVAIREVERILLLHLADIDGGTASNSKPAGSTSATSGSTRQALDPVPTR